MENIGNRNCKIPFLKTSNGAVDYGSVIVDELNNYFSNIGRILNDEVLTNNRQLLVALATVRLSSLLYLWRRLLTL